CLAPRRNRRRHDRLLDLDRAAGRAFDQAALALLVVISGIRKPDFEFMFLVADERVTDHGTLLTGCRCAGSAIGSTISNRRPCCSDGTRARAAATAAGSISAMITPGSVPPSAMTLPHGSTTSEWPKVERPFSCWPPCAAAITYQVFSMARARISTF